MMQVCSSKGKNSTLIEQDDLKMAFKIIYMLLKIIFIGIYIKLKIGAVSFPVETFQMAMGEET